MSFSAGVLLGVVRNVGTLIVVAPSTSMSLTELVKPAVFGALTLGICAALATTPIWLIWLHVRRLRSERRR